MRDPASAAGPVTPPAQVAPLPENFEAAMTELESLIGQMESGRLPLAASLTAYERGVVLLKHCREQLADVTQQVQVLEAGLLVPFDAADAPGKEQT